MHKREQLKRLPPYVGDLTLRNSSTFVRDAAAAPLHKKLALNNCDGYRMSSARLGHH